MMKTRTIHSGRRLPRRFTGKAGFSLIEVLVALTLLSIILMGLARVTFQMAAFGRTNDTVAKRSATLIEEANKFNAMPYSYLASVNTTTQDLTYGDFKFQRRLTVTANSANWTTIKIVVTPYIGGILTPSKKDSVFVHRTLAPGSPLCTTC
jgi:prepilin-type N-terminal cleavage/methylation domain-containing protein